MKIISACNRKGGSGKTTVLYNIAGILTLRKKLVTILDADPQGSLYSAWMHRTKEIPHLQVIHDPSFDNNLKTFHSIKSDYLLIDTPPVIASYTKQAMTVCQYAIIPLNPSALDFNASLPILNLAKEAKVKCLWILNRVKAHTIIAQSIYELAREKELPVSKIMIPDSVAISEAISEGLPLCYYEKNHYINKLFEQLVSNIK